MGDDERPTVRPVTLARLVETTDVCNSGPRLTAELETALEVTHRRARETLLEAIRIGLINEKSISDEPQYETTHIGEEFLATVRSEEWQAVSDILAARSPHYGAFLEAIDAVAPAKLGTILDEIQEAEQYTPRSYNQTSVEVVGDWAERLGIIQRHAFTGRYYPVETHTTPENFPVVLLGVYDELEETAGIGLEQHYLSIPKLREHVCERLNCTRDAFDQGLLSVVNENVGKLELSGAPIDTGVKDAKLGIKQIELADSGGLVSTTQSTELVMRGVEQFGKQYYYLAVHDANITYSTEEDS